MGEHKVKERAEKERLAFKEKVAQRMLSDDMTFGDFSKLDGCGVDDIYVSTNDVTTTIWNDILDLTEQYIPLINDPVKISQTLEDVFSEIGNIVADKLAVLQVPHDDRFSSEVAEEEHVTMGTAKAYKMILNIGITCTDANMLHPLSMIGKYSYIDIIRMNINRKELEPMISYSVKRLLEKQVEKIKIKDLVN